MKKISIITIILGAVLTILGIIPFFYTQMLPTVKSIGIIGGAESEITEQVIRQLRYNSWTSSCYPILLIIGLFLIVLGIVLLIIKLKK